MSRRSGRGVAWSDDNDRMGGIRRGRGDSCAILDDVGRWSYDAAPEIAESLDRDCAPTGDPGEDAWGHDVLIKAAQRFQGIAWLGPERLTS